jgi:hypothetical protein
MNNHNFKKLNQATRSRTDEQPQFQKTQSSHPLPHRSPYLRAPLTVPVRQALPPTHPPPPTPLPPL